MSTSGMQRPRLSRLSPTEPTRHAIARESKARFAHISSKHPKERAIEARASVENARALGAVIEGHARSGRVVLRIGDDARDIRRRLDIQPCPFTSVLQDPAFRTIEITASYAKSDTPVTVDLRGAELNTTMTKVGQSIALRLNKRGERLILFDRSLQNDAHYRIAAWASLIDGEAVMPPPVFLPQVAVKNAARFGLHKGAAYVGYLFEHPDGDWISLTSDEVLAELSIENARRMLAEFRRIIYGLRLRGIVPKENVSIFVNPTAGHVRLGGISSLHLFDVNVLHDEELIAEPLLFPDVPYASNLVAMLLKDSNGSLAVADRAIEQVDLMFRKVLGSEINKEHALYHEAAARLFASDLSLFIRMNPKFFNWAQRAAWKIVDELSKCGPPAVREIVKSFTSQIDDGIVRYLSSRLGDGAIDVEDELDISQTRGVIEDFIQKYFPGMRYANHINEIVETALHIIHTERMIDRNKLISSVPSAAVFEPAVRALIDIGGVYMFGRTPWPGELVDVVRKNPYLQFGSNITWGYAEKLCRGVRESMRVESSGWLEINTFGSRTIPMPLGWSFGARAKA